jgi:threonylcarbamoyladenosine tRNA methylthiotransferase MtaB
LKKVKIMTLGCKVNQYESRALGEALEREGYAVARGGHKSDESPDVVVINTCTVTHRSDSDARAMVRRAQREHPGAKIVVSGCYAETDPEAVASLGADLVVGTAQKAELARFIVEERLGVFSGDADTVATLDPAPVSGFERSRAFFKVQDGCEAYCAYCIVPFARGPSRSLAPEEVGAGLKRLVDGGHREIVLTGIHLGYWGKELDPVQSFTRLLEIAEGCGADRVRLSSLEPLELTDEVIGRVAASDVLCPHLHIPLQSGSDTVLARMGRPYTAGQFRKSIESALERIEGVCLGFDVIVGFPGETEAEFNETLALLEALDFCYLHVFPYSPRKGTRAFEMEGRVADVEIKRRGAVLRTLAREKREAFYRSHVGQTTTVLAERFLNEGAGAQKRLVRARTANYIEVDLEWQGSLPVTQIPVRLVGWDGERLTAEVLTTRAVENNQ